MSNHSQHPEQVAVWEVNDETGEVEDVSSYTNWKD